jgi:2-oxo-3-hexenedioate decarboxylase
VAFPDVVAAVAGECGEGTCTREPAVPGPGPYRCPATAALRVAQRHTVHRRLADGARVGGRQREVRVIDARQVAAELIRAERARAGIPPVSCTRPDFDLAAAYAVQELVVEARTRAGEVVVGAKLGLTSRAEQLAHGATGPVYGLVTSAMFVPYGEAADAAALIQPRAEPEIAFLLSRDVRGPATVASVLAATDEVFGAVAVVDSRYVGGYRTAADLAADNCGVGKLLLGGEGRPPADLADLRLVGCVVSSAGEVVATATGAAALGHPAAAVAWLANELAARGEVLPAGWLVFTGGLTPPVPLPPGGYVAAELDGLGLVEAYA